VEREGREDHAPRHPRGSGGGDAMTLVIIPTAVVVMITALFILFWWRNNKVYEFRIALIEEGYRNWLESWDASPHERHSYEEMVFKFWRPLRPEYWR
jgi:hypothetical protein